MSDDRQPHTPQELDTPNMIDDTIAVGSTAPPADAADYGADKIKVLEGLEAVRKRPAMYIGSTGPAGLHHLVYEIVDNSIDEALAGFCKNVSVTIHIDGSVTVVDDGRGIPVDMHESGKSAAEVALTVLHAGGKFENSAYKVSGGLHGVGASVVNALSSELKVEVKRDGYLFRQAFHRGKPEGDVKRVEPARGTGTTVTFTPDVEIFRDQKFDLKTVTDRLDVKAFLNKGLTINFTDDSTGQQTTFHHAGGVADLFARAKIDIGARRADDRRPGVLRDQQMPKARLRLLALDRKLTLDPDRRADRDPVKELGDLGIPHPDAAVAAGPPHPFLVVGAVDVDVAAHGVDFAKTILAGLHAAEPEHTCQDPIALRVAGRKFG